MEHTPTPWRISVNHEEKHDLISYEICTEDNSLAFFEGGLLIDEVNYANAMRCIECVNACAEFSDPKIDIGLLKLHLEQQTKLLASCEAALDERDATIQALQDRVKAYEAIGLDMAEKAEYFADMDRVKTDKLLHETYKVLTRRFEKIINK